jgi:hypothetical protein
VEALQAQNTSLRQDLARSEGLAATAASGTASALVQSQIAQRRDSLRSVDASRGMEESLKAHELELEVFKLREQLQHERAAHEAQLLEVSVLPSVLHQQLRLISLCRPG